VESLAQWGLHLLEQHAGMALFLVLLMEESGIPLPLPGDLVMVVAGVRVAQGRLNLLVALALMEVATLIGASLLYLLARRGGRPMLYRYSKFLHLELDKLAKAEEFLHRHGALAIVVGRVVPGLRIPTSLAAGVFGVPYRVYLPSVAVGATIYICFFFWLGYFAGPQVLEIVEGPHFSVRLVADLIGLGLVIAAYVAIRRRTHLTTAPHVLPEGFRLETALMAGLLATATMSLAVDLLLYVLTALGVGGPAGALMGLGSLVGQRLGARPFIVLAGGISLYVVLQLAWAIVYAHVERWLPEPDWLGGLLFAVLPLAFSLLVVLPALGAGVIGWGLDRGWMPLLGEIVRHAIYGWALATSYTLLARARTPKRLPLPGSAAEKVG
jgi:membrane protein DedA with SNARE-associated domain